MNTIKNMLGAGALALGTVVSVGCSANPSPLSSTGGNVIAVVASIGKPSDLVLDPGRSHDISNADSAGTVQFRVKSAPAGDFETLLGSEIYYQDGSGANLTAKCEVTFIKGTQSQIVTVRSTEPLPPDKWYGLVVQTGNGIQVSDAARTAADRRWRMRLFTGSDPQFVVISEDGSHIHVGISEPVNLRDVNLSISSGGSPIAGCFETSDGCVPQVTAANVFTEEVSFKLASAAIPQALELSTKGAGLLPIQLAQGSWQLGVDGGQSWRRPSAAD